MRILWIGGSHPRHLYYINKIAAQFDVIGAIIEEREHMLPEPPGYLGEHDKALWELHFCNRDHKEAVIFGEQYYPDCDVMKVQGDELNSTDVLSKIQKLKYDICLVFGCGMIREPIISALPEHTYNLHLGLSPRYRGAATLFWPFYFLEPHYAGCTFHNIVHEPDAGDIIHQSVPVLFRGDTIHEVACRAVVAATADICFVLEVVEHAGKIKRQKQRATGKNFLASDFQSQHLRMIYDVCDDDLVRMYLDGEIKPTADPHLFRGNIP